jgi:hypothetical protein
MDRNTAQNEDYFIKTKEIVDNLRHSGMLKYGSGYCLSNYFTRKVLMLNWWNAT